MVANIKNFSGFALVIFAFSMGTFTYPALGQDVNTPQEIENPNILFFQGNSYYKEGDYEKAIEIYEKLLLSGVKDSNLYYNLGNAYFKLGRKGKAILNYEKAFLLIPRDADLEANLSYARSLIQNGGSREKPWFLEKILSFHNLININEGTLLVFALYIIIILLLTLAILFKGWRKIFYYPIAVSAALIVIASVSLAFKIYERDFQRKAIIISEETEAKYEPSENATTHYTLHEGETVKIEEGIDSWYKVARWDGKVGWVRKDDLEIFTGLE